MEFRKLRADEIEVRVARVTKNSVQLLLYKDARCDQNILDETPGIGPMNWQRHHSRDNANCIVSIWDSEKGQWIEKEDTGTESFTEKEKGLASDSFKRACFNWGIGRELYTAPDLYFPIGDTKAADGKCYDRFEVSHIEYDGNKISGVEIVDTYTNKKYSPYMKSFGKKVEQPKEDPVISPEQSTAIKKRLADADSALLKENKVSMTAIKIKYGIKESLSELKQSQLDDLNTILDSIGA